MLSSSQGVKQARRSKEARRLPSLVRLLATFVIIVSIALGGAAVLQGWRADRDSATRVMESVLIALSQHLETALGSMEGILAGVGKRYSGTTINYEDLSRDLEAIGQPLAFMRAAILVDPNGMVAADSRPGRPAVGLDVSDRDYFLVHRVVGETPAFVSPPIKSRVDGVWSFPISHAVRAPDGSLTGVLVASISNAYINDLFSKLGRTYPGLDMVLTNLNGVLQASWPPRTGAVGDSLAESRLIREQVPVRVSGTYWGTSPLDGITRLIVFQRLNSLPLALAVGMDSSVVYSDTAGHALLWGGVVLTVVLIILLAARQLERMALALEDARTAAEAADHRKDEFMANMSHEIRTPLNAIIGFSEIMHLDSLQAGMAPVYAGYARDILDSGRYLLDIVDEVLDMSAILAHRVTLREAPLDPATLIADLVHMVQVRARKRSIDLTIDSGTDDARPGPPPMVFADRRRLSQVVLNLLSNAIKYTQKGGQVRVRLSAGPDGVRLIVRDNGPGIMPDRLTIIMEPFERETRSDLASVEGVGLGLAVARGLIEAHGGTLRITSEPGGGTEAVAWLPPSRCLPRGPVQAPTQSHTNGI